MAGSDYARAATRDDIPIIAQWMRECDRLEVWQSHRQMPESALEQSFKHSSRVWTGLTKDGLPCCMFGVAAQSALSDTGSPWLLATDDVYKVWIELLRHSKYYVGQMSEGFSLLENWVAAHNTTSIRWLKWCGFELEEAAPFGPDQVLFHRFTMGGTSCAMGG